MKYNFPSQKKKSTQKGPKWGRDHLDWAESLLLDNSTGIRSSIKKKIRNFNSYNGKISLDAYETVLNPNSLKNYFLPATIQHFPIAVPYLNVLIGEEFDRRFEWKGVVTNPNAISKIEEDKSNMLKSKIVELLNNPDLKTEEAEEQLKNFIYYLKFEYQDIREKRVNLFLKHFIKELDLKLKFNEGFKNVLIAGEESYLAEVINNRPVISLIDPKKITVLRSGNSNRIEDADVIAIWDHISPGQALDKYYKFLSSKEVSILDKDPNNSYGSAKGSDLERDEFGINILRNEMVDDMINISDIIGNQENPNINTEVYDKFGNIREIKLYWKSKKMIKRVKSYDQDSGEVIYSYESENYIPNLDLGEEVEEYWVSQWWEAVKLADNIYPYARPRDIQYNKFEDPGYNHPGIVGQIYNTGNQGVTSVMDRAMPFQLLYDGVWYRVVDALSKFFGSMPVVDYAKIPEGWDIDKWLYFARKAGIAVENSFKEGNKGASLGKMAGGLSGSQNVINQSALGDYIQQQINMLTYIESQMGRIIGVPPQRLGDIQNRETVGGVERAVTQSSFITNELYKIHDNVKKRVLTLLIETCKVAYKGNPMKFQYISDDFINQIFEIDDDFLEEEFGIIIDNDNDLSKLEAQLEGLVQAALQNQMLKFSDVMKIYNSSSMSEKQRLIEKSEEDLMKRKEQEQKANQEIAQAQLEQNAKIEEDKAIREDLKFKAEQDLDKYKIDQDNLTKRMQLGLNEPEETDESYDLEKLELEYKKHEDEMMAKMKELDEKIRNNKQKEKLEGKKIQKMSTKPATKK